MKNYLAALQMADQYIDFFSQIVPDKKKNLFWEMTLDYGKRSMQTYIDWADSCIAKLRQNIDFQA